MPMSTKLTVFLALVLAAGPFASADELFFRDGTKAEVKDLTIEEKEVVCVMKGMRAVIPLEYVDLERTRAANARPKEEAAEKEDAPPPGSFVPNNELTEPLTPDPASKRKLPSPVLSGEEARALIGQWDAAMKDQVRKLGQGGPPAGSVFDIPMAARDSVTGVNCLLNKRLPDRFVVDTGAEVTTLSGLTARRAGVKMGSARFLPLRLAKSSALAGWGTLEELRIGPLILHDVPVLVVDGAEDNLLGQNLLHHFVVTLDYPAGMLRLAIPPKPAETR